MPDQIQPGIKVSVVYVGPTRQVSQPLETAAGTTVRAAIERCGLLDLCPELDLGTNKVGIYGKLVGLDQVLEDGDRVEVYRPLIADPKEARKRRAQEGKPLRKGESGGAEVR